MELASKRLKIRNLCLDDLEAYYAYASNIEVAELAGFKPIPDLETARFKLCGMIFNQESFAIEYEGILIGTINLYHNGIRKLDSVYTLGISLNKDYWHLGLGREAIKLLVGYAFRVRGANYLEIRHDIRNLRSKKMIEGLGFHYDGTIMNYAKNYKNEIYSISIYSLSKEKFMEDIYLWENY